MSLALLSDQDCVLDVKFNPTGTVLASASKDHTIRMWEPTVQVTKHGI